MTPGTRVIDRRDPSTIGVLQTIYLHCGRKTASVKFPHGLRRPRLCELRTVAGHAASAKRSEATKKRWAKAVEKNQANDSDRQMGLARHLAELMTAEYEEPVTPAEAIRRAAFVDLTLEQMLEAFEE